MIKKLLLILFVSIILVSCNQKIKKIEKDEFTFGTYISITVYDTDDKKAEKAIKEAFLEMERIDKKYNSKVESSDIYKLNSGEIKEIELDNEGVYIFSELKKVYELSDKKYDITIEPLVELWDFGREDVESIPTPEEIREVLKKIDFDNVVLKGNILSYKKDGVRIDTGSFLKGYAIERAKNILKKNGITSSFISSISSIETIGTKPEEKPWKIGVENPENPDKLIAIVELDGRGMGVSGDYQTYIEYDGKKYHHILDKNSGYPVEDKKMVVVICDDAFLCDMYSTAFFLMDISKVIEFANKNNIDVMIVDKDMKITTTKNMKYEKIEE